MNITRKLLFIAALGIVTASLTSCLVRQNPHKKWTKRHNRAYYYKSGGGRTLWVRDNFRNTR